MPAFRDGGCLSYPLFKVLLAPSEGRTLSFKKGLVGSGTKPRKAFPKGKAPRRRSSRTIPTTTDHRRLVLGMPKTRRRMGERMPGERRTTIFMSVDLLFCGLTPVYARTVEGDQSDDSMINTPPRRTEMKATLPVSSLDTANCRPLCRVARLRGYLQPSMSTPLTTASAASRERYL